MSDRRHTDAPAQGCFRSRHSGRHGSSESRGPPAYRLLYNQSKALYRLHACPAGAPAPSVPGYTEIEQYPTKEEVRTTLRHWPNLFCFVVFEDRENGTVVFDRLSNLSGNWLDENRFDRFTLFNTEEAAAAYAAERQARYSTTPRHGP